MNHPKSFCARPGCRIARAIHGTTATACGNYIDPTSKAGMAILRSERQQAEAVRECLRLVTPLPLVDDVEEPTIVEAPKTVAQVAAEWGARLEARS